MNETTPIPWSQERRLRVLDFRLTWDGFFNRRALTEMFDISVPQASLDVAKYTALAPYNLKYDASAREYVRTRDFQPVYTSSLPQNYLAQLLAVGRGVVPETESIIGFRPPVALVPLPNRAVDADVLRELLWAIRVKRGLEVDYQSIARDEPPRRCIFPHAVAYDGLRWHARAYCEQRGGFFDFILGRILAVHRRVEESREAEADADWYTELDLVLSPHPSLAPGPRRGVEIDYSMRAGRAIVRCRKAMLFYFLRVLGFDPKGMPLPGNEQVVLSNIDELRAHLPVPGQPPASLS